ncbi:cysteine-type endopeptidase [Trypoxylus dichotomus]
MNANGVMKFQRETKSNRSMGTVVTESKTFTQTTTTISTVGGYSRVFSSNNPSTGANALSSNFLAPRLTEGRQSFHGNTTYSVAIPYRSAFNNQPSASYTPMQYRSFNTNSSKAPPTEPEPEKIKKSKSLFSVFKSSNKEKDDKPDKKLKEKEKSKKDDEKKAKKAKEKDAKNNQKAATDAKLVAAPPILNNNFNFSNRQYFNLGDMDKKLVIKVTKSKQFLPVEVDKIPTYDTKSKYNRGKVLIINNINFSKDKFRAGAQVDHKNITNLFKEMGFTVQDHQNKSKQNIEKIIKEYCNHSSLKYADINVTVIMSHGNGVDTNTYIETIDNDVISTEWIVNEFSNTKCKYLANKPKLFFFQCCRGEGRDVQTDAVPFQAARTGADMLLAFATIPGFVSHRDPKLGTWYIQAICKIFMEHAHDTDVENLLKIVDENLAQNYTSHRQTSSYENRGFKRCYLNPI